MSIIQCEVCIFCEKDFATGYDGTRYGLLDGICKKDPPVFIGINKDGNEIWSQPIIGPDSGCSQGVPE